MLRALSFCFGLVAAEKTWDVAHAEAAKVVDNMTAEEQRLILNGVGYDRSPFLRFPIQRKWWYVGNTPAIPRLGIPSLNMQDSSAGFRGSWTELVGTMTCWPSLLAFAASWDPDLVGNFAQALGREFSGKGANVVLGPSVNVHRVAKGGRNWEYLSGEDPYLGSKLAKAYVQGIQSEGVAAVVKHWVFNEQETNRNTESSDVDDKTSWELYYPPFEAAVEAGVLGAMCSYNRIQGQHACSNPTRLAHLKSDMGFRGFVQSDWWAADQTSSVDKGLDQDMPGTDGYFAPNELAPHSSAVRAAAQRVVAAIHRLDIKSRCTPPHCESFFRKNVTNAGHVDLARRAAAASIVLLKNEHALPISSKVKTIAVIGSAAVAKPLNNAVNSGTPWNQGDYYSGGGSGHVSAGQVVNPLEGIKQRAASSGIEVLASTSNSRAEASAVASRADLVIVVAATTSGEGRDRPHLHLDGFADGLISAVAASAKKTVVLVQAPGAVLMPWKDEVDGIAVMFLGGQETGNAWASVIFGDQSPEGRLPIMLPATDADTIGPTFAPNVPYTERMETSYRNKQFKAAYPFGHGLSYTKFRYSPPQLKECPALGEKGICLLVQLRNEGQVAGKAVPQLYLEFPSHADHPAPILKGFRKTVEIPPGQSAWVTFKLSDRDFRYFKDDAWVTDAADFTAHIGDSSKDIRHSVPIHRSTGLLFA